MNKKMIFSQGSIRVENFELVESGIPHCEADYCVDYIQANVTNTFRNSEYISLKQQLLRNINKMVAYLNTNMSQHSYKTY